MADIELVIKIPEEIYQHYKKIWRKRRGSIPESCIAFGTPLRKGHKRLIEDNFEVGPVFDKEENRVGYRYITQEDLKNAPTNSDVGMILCGCTNR